MNQLVVFESAIKSLFSRSSRVTTLSGSAIVWDESDGWTTSAHQSPKVISRSWIRWSLRVHGQREFLGPPWRIWIASWIKFVLTSVIWNAGAKDSSRRWINAPWLTQLAIASHSTKSAASTLSVTWWKHRCWPPTPISTATCTTWAMSSFPTRTIPTIAIWSRSASWETRPRPCAIQSSTSGTHGSTRCSRCIRQRCRRTQRTNWTILE